jgi:hypothetical protein
MLLLLPRTLFSSEAVFLRQTASKPSVRASTNMDDALQKRRSLNNTLKALLY